MEDFLHTHKEAFGIEIKDYHIVFEDNKKEYFDNVREKAFEIIENIKNEYKELINSKEDLEKYRKENNLIEEKNNIINDAILNWKREADRHNETKLFELPYDKDRFKDYIKEIAYDITDEKIKMLEDKYNFKLEIPELKDINYLKKEDDNKQIIFKRGAEVLELKYEKFNLELANGIIKKFEENCNNFYGRYESQEFSEEKYNISKLLDSENFNNDIRYFVLDKIQELSSTLDEKEIVEISFIGLEKEKNKEIDFQKVEENLLNKGAKILKNIKKDIIDNISYQNGNFEYVYKKNIDKMKDEIENELKEIDKQLKEKDKNNNFEKEL